MHIGDNIVKFTTNNDGIYLSKLDTEFLGNCIRLKKEDDCRIYFENPGVKQKDF